MIWIVGTALAGEAELSAAIDAARAADPQGAATIAALPYQVAPTGAPLFAVPVPPGLAAIVVDRLVHGGESLEVRIALAGWLKRSGDPFAAVAVDAMKLEANEAVRAALVEVLRYDDRPASRPAVIDGLRLGLRDPAAPVRAAAARGIGWAAADELVVDLVVAAADPDDGVAGAAARSIGWLAARAPEGAFPAVAAVLGRADPRARLEAVHALERLDRARAAAAVRALVADPDPRVARAAAALIP